MTIERIIVRVAMRATDFTRARLVFRGAERIGASVRIFGWPSVARDGALRVGERVTLISTPSPVTIVIERGGSLAIGDDVLVESGVTICARGRVVIGARACLGARCVVDDVSVGEDARVAEGATLEKNRTHESGALRRRRDATSERVRMVLGAIVHEVRAIDSHADFTRARGWDSLAALRALVALEHELGVRLPHDFFTSASTIDSVAAAVRSVS